MILYYSSNVRAFNSEGASRYKVLLLKFFNNYSIKTFFKLIKMLQIRSKLNIDIYSFMQKIVSNYILDLPFFKSNLFNKFFSFKKFIIFSFLILFKRFFRDEVVYDDIFLSFNLTKKELSLPELGGVRNKPLSFLNPQFLPSSFNNRYSHFMYKYYNKSKFLQGRKNFLKVSENKYSRSIFVTGHVFSFYRGSITPFYKAKFSWLVSTGLKADVECDDLETDKAMYHREEKEEENYNDIYDDKLKDIVFKVYNFKKSFTRDFKKKARHYITYALYQDGGVKGFLSEKKSTFFYKQTLWL